MQGFLVRVGIDQAFGHWNAPVDPTTNDFVYVSIPQGHRAENSGRTGNHGATLEQRQDLFGAQEGLCPICDNEVDVWDSIDHDHATGEVRAILHGNCNRLVGFAEAVGPKGVQRLRNYLWPNLPPPSSLR